MKTLIVLALLTFAQWSLAAVDAVTRDFRVAHLDLESKDKKLSLRRSYHSARQELGWFGAGMCTVFESRIIILKEKPHFQYCGAGAILPLDGSFGLSVSESLGSQTVKGRRYSYQFDKKGNLRRISFKSQVVYELMHKGSKIKVQGRGFSLLLSKADGLVQKVKFGDDLFEYGYTDQGELSRVKKNGKSLYKYTWVGGKLVEYSSYSGFSKKVSYNDRGQVVSVASEDCLEKLSNEREGRQAYMKVSRKCKGQPEKTKRIMVSGRDKRLNYKVKQVLEGRTLEMQIRNGFLATKQENGHKFSYDYDQSGRIKRMQIDQALLTVASRDQFHAKSVRVSTVKNPDNTLTELSMNWLNGSLVSYRLGDRLWKFKETKYGQVLSSQQYRLSLLKRGSQVLVKGMWRGKKIKPFRTDRGPASLSPHQQEVVSEIISQDRFRKALEAL